VHGKRAVLSLDIGGGDEETASLRRGNLSGVDDQPAVLAGRAARAHRSRGLSPCACALSDDQLLWGYNLTFGAARTEIEFASSYLRLAVVQDLASLKVFLRTAPQWLVIRFRNQDGVSTQVYQRLRGSHYSRWPALEALAADLHMSPSTLRRRLEREVFVSGDQGRSAPQCGVGVAVPDTCQHRRHCRAERFSGTQCIPSRVQEVDWREPWSLPRAGPGQGVSACAPGRLSHFG
jgi:AraC-like DNA-binding protein